jgi:uncharacterized membrane protein YkvA (DUF1232 family)
MRRMFLFWRRGGADVRRLWFALRHPDRPRWLLPAAALLAVYALEPANFAFPMLGIVDDMVLLPLLLRGLLAALPAHVAGGDRTA